MSGEISEAPVEKSRAVISITIVPETKEEEIRTIEKAMNVAVGLSLDGFTFSVNVTQTDGEPTRTNET